MFPSIAAKRPSAIRTGAASGRLVRVRLEMPPPRARFGFPFFLAVRDHGKAAILEMMERRPTQDRDTEFAGACHQVERIAHHRLPDILTP